ncbi:Met-10+-like protein [Ordospora pajunii]|uniref:Met-10+-like protein n=1 Tax=Ordospora pajunii TaxID=3039483 RepID=UPI0029527A1E|nr:Met-10+-like protein [Ordospora pajunii]KAH9411636.1 Met-10+-like protein [Ordospora pajunii]
MMDEKESMRSIIRSLALAMSNSEASEMISRHRGSARRIARIPSVIHTKKQYACFKVMTIVDCDILMLVDDSKCKIEETGCIYTWIDIELNYNYFTYAEVLEKMLPTGVQVPSSFEIVGSIAHLNLDGQQMDYRHAIGRVIHEKTGMTVITKVGCISNEFRSFDLEVIGGEPNLQTVHKEGGLLFCIDYKNVYWCSKLQNERLELLRMFMPGETVCDLFCGVGPVSLRALKNGCKVYANDLNPHAIECIKASIEANKLKSSNIEVFNLTADEFLSVMVGRRIDHFFLNLPEHSLEYLERISAWNADALVHCYFFSRNDEDVEQYIFRKIGLKVSKDLLRIVRKVSPSKSMYKLEASCELLRAGFVGGY